MKIALVSAVAPLNCRLVLSLTTFYGEKQFVSLTEIFMIVKQVSYTNSH